MQIVTGSTIASNDFINQGRGVAEFRIAYTIFGSGEISEIVLPLGIDANIHPGTKQLILEMSLRSWQETRKRAFSHILPWGAIVPPAWTGLRVRCASSNARHPVYAPLHTIPGHFDIVDGHPRFAINDDPKAILDAVIDESRLKPYETDLLIRHPYGETFRYHGTTPAQATSAGALFFQTVPDPSNPHNGVEYWVISNR